MWLMPTYYFTIQNQNKTPYMYHFLFLQVCSSSTNINAGTDNRIFWRQVLVTLIIVQLINMATRVHHYSLPSPSLIILKSSSFIKCSTFHEFYCPRYSWFESYRFATLANSMGKGHTFYFNQRTFINVREIWGLASIIFNLLMPTGYYTYHQL